MDATRPSNVTWGSQTAEEDQTIALAAQVENVKGGLKLANNIVANYDKVMGTIMKNKPVKLRVNPTFKKIKKTLPKEGEPHENILAQMTIACSGKTRGTVGVCIT